MKIRKAYRYELKPNVQQRILLAKHAGVARFAYNWGLQRRIDMYEKDKTSTNAIAQHRELNSKKTEEFPWMYEVSKCAPQEALRDLDKAFHNFFRGIKQGNKIGFPKFKKKAGHNSFRLTGTIKVFENSVQLPRLGEIRLKETTKCKGQILSATINRRADRWFVSLTVELEIVKPEQIQGPTLGIDVGLTSFFTTSENVKINAPKPLAKNLKKLQRLSKQHSRKQKGSNNRKKSAFKLAKKHLTISNQRIDFLHKHSTALTKTKSLIVVENLKIKDMLQNQRLSRHITDAGWGIFIRMLEYKAPWYGSKIIKAPRYYPSTKTCSHCGYVRDSLPLHVRKWQCDQCQLEHDRDVNAAINLSKLNTESSSGIYACGDSSNEIGKKPMSYVSMKQEITNGIFVHKL